MYIYFDHESMTLTMELLLGSSDGALASCKTQLSQRLPEVAFKILFSNYFQTFQ